MLKIVVDEGSHGPVRVLLEGQLIDPWVRELMDEIMALPAAR